MGLPFNFMTGDHIGNDGYEPQRSNNGLIWLTPTQAMQQAGVNLARDEIRLSTQGFPLPKATLGVIEFGYMNEKRKFPGVPTYDDMALVFKDYVDTDTARILRSWFELVHNPQTGRTAFKSQYACDGWCAMYAPDGSTERRYIIRKVWPSAFDPGDIDHDGEDIVRINLTLNVEKAYIDQDVFSAPVTHQG